MRGISDRSASLSPEEKRELLARLLDGQGREPGSGEDDRRLPLSYGQQALWYLHQLAPDSAAYHIMLAWRIRTPLDAAALQAAFQSLTERHPSLRTTYAVHDSRPVQEIHSRAKLDFEAIDMTSSSPPDLATRVSSEAHRPFDLERELPLRVRVFELGAQDHVLLLAAHHIALDLWSLAVLLDELSVLYEAAASGRRAVMPAAAVGYEHYVKDQARRLAGPDGERMWSYWQSQLGDLRAGDGARLELPTDRPRPAVQTHDGATRSLRLTSTLTRRLKALARAEETTLYTTLLTAFFVLIHRHTGQDDILVGSPVAGRNRPEFQRVVGYFTSPVVIRARLSGSPTFRELLKQVHHTVLDALEHQDYPLPLLIERLLPARDPGRSPLFQVLFALHSLPRAGYEALGASSEGIRVNIGGLVLEPYHLEQRAAQLDLELQFVEADGSLVACLQYNADLFDAATIDRMLERTQRLLESVVDTPDARIGTLELLASAERHQLVVSWNHTSREYSSGQAVHQLFESTAARTPGATALVSEAGALTYRDLNRRANRLAHRLRGMGIGPESLVGICLQPSPETVVALLGVLKSGAAFVPLDPAYPTEHTAFVLDDAKVDVVITERGLSDFVTRAGARPRLICVDALDDSLPDDGSEDPSHVTRADNLLCVIYTSGTTGRPKGSMLTHAGIRNCLLWFQERYGLAADDRLLQKAPLNFDVSVWEVLWPLSVGASVVLTPPGGQADAAALVDLIRKHRVTVVQFVPSMLRVVLEQPGFEMCDSLRHVISGGEVLPHETQRRFVSRQRARLHNLYGPTETSIAVTAWACDESSRGRTVPIGRPIANTSIFILDTYGSPVPVGVVGELHIGGASLARGYLNRPRQTAGRFIPDPFSREPGARLYRTGDLARFLQDGTIEFVGRADHQIKLRGNRVELEAIDEVLCRHPALDAAVVAARADAPSGPGPRLVAYIVPKAGHAPAVAELRVFLREKLPEHMVPSTFVTLPRLPLSASGKVDRNALPPPRWDQPDGARAFVEPRTATERMLAGVWADVLGLARVGVHDNFFEVGGDSILGIQVVAKANRVGLAIRPRHLLQHQTIAELAAAGVESARAGRADRQSQAGPVPLTPIQRWFFEDEPSEPNHWNQAVLLEPREAVDAQVLDQALRRLPEHHESLRLRFVRSPQGWKQTNAERGDRGDIVMARIDLSGTETAERDAAVESAAAGLHSQLDLAKGPLAAAALFDLGAGEPMRLLIVIHHLVADWVSWHILLEDLESAYRSLARGEAPVLPPEKTSFREWAALLREHAAGDAWRELASWLPGSAGEIDDARIPLDFPDGTNMVGSGRVVETALGRDETRILLRDIPRTLGIQPRDALVMAVVQAFADWAQVAPLTLDVESHGRQDVFEEVDLTRTVGWFTTFFPVRCDLRAAQTTGSRLEAAREQLRGVPPGGIGYGVLRYLAEEVHAPDEDAARNLARLRAVPPSQVGFNYLGNADQILSGTTMFRFARESSGPARSPRGRRRHLFEINGWVADGQLRTAWTYSENQYRRTTVATLVRCYADALRSAIACWQSDASAPGRQPSPHTPADFPAANITQRELDRLVHRLNRDG